MTLTEDDLKTLVRYFEILAEIDSSVDSGDDLGIKMS